MAAQDILPIRAGIGQGHHGKVFKWTAVDEADSGLRCKPVNIQGAKDITIFVEGSFGSGGTIGLNVSPMLDLSPADAVYALTNDLSGTLIAIAANGHKAVSELGAYYQPKVTAGTSVNVDIYLEARY